MIPSLPVLVGILLVLFSKWPSRVVSEIWLVYPLCSSSVANYVSNMSFVTRLGNSNICICKRMINELRVVCNRFPELPITGTFSGEAASLPVFPISRKKYACPAARRDFLLSPRPFSFRAQQHSCVKVTAGLQWKVKLPLLRSVFLQRALYLIFSCSETFPLIPRCFYYLLSMLYSNVSWSKSPLASILPSSYLPFAVLCFLLSSVHPSG